MGARVLAMAINASQMLLPGQLAISWDDFSYLCSIWQLKNEHMKMGAT